MSGRPNLKRTLSKKHKPSLDLRQALDSARISFEADLKRSATSERKSKNNNGVVGVAGSGSGVAVVHRSKEVANLHLDEGVIHLLHALPSSRRKVSYTSVLSSHLNDSLSLSSNRRPSTECSVRVQTPVALTQTLRKNNLKFQQTEAAISKVSPESLMTDHTLELLKQLPKHEYIKLWSSPSRYFLKDDEDEEEDISEDLRENQKSDFLSGGNGSIHGGNHRFYGTEDSSYSIHWIHKQYKDIMIRTYPNFAQILVSPTSTGIKCTINANVCDEICDAVSALERDDQCRAVLVSGLGSVFCQGIDLSLLTFDSVEKQRRNAESLANAIKRLVKTILNCSRLLFVAAVNGHARGLAVSILPLFDVVYASDKAEFEIPYAKLGMIPEACGSVTFGDRLCSSEMMMLGKIVSANEAQTFGFVSSVLWPDKFFEEIVPRLQMTDLLAASGVKIVKAAVKERLKRRVLETIEEETRVLVRQWTSPEFVKNARQYLRTSNLTFQ